MHQFYITSCFSLVTIFHWCSNQNEFYFYWYRIEFSLASDKRWGKFNAKNLLIRSTEVETLISLFKKLYKGSVLRCFFRFTNETPWGSDGDGALGFSTLKAFRFSKFHSTSKSLINTEFSKVLCTPFNVYSTLTFTELHLSGLTLTIFALFHFVAWTYITALLNAILSVAQWFKHL